MDSLITMARWPCVHLCMPVATACLKVWENKIFIHIELLVEVTE